MHRSDAATRSAGKSVHSESHVSHSQLLHIPVLLGGFRVVIPQKTRWLEEGRPIAAISPVSPAWCIAEILPSFIYPINSVA